MTLNMYMEKQLLGGPMNFEEMQAHYKRLYGRELLEEDLEVLLKNYVLDKTKKYDKVVLDKLVCAEFRCINDALTMLTELEERKEARRGPISDNPDKESSK